VNAMFRAMGTRFDINDLLIVGIALTLALTGVSSLLSPVGNIAVSAVVVLVWLLLGLRRSRRRRGGGREGEFQERRRGVLFTVGLKGVERGSLLDLVVDRLEPEVVGLLVTSETAELSGIEEFKRRSRVAVTIERVDLDDWEGCRRATGRALDELLDRGLGPDELVVDITGGPKTLSLAAFLAAEDHQVETQYIKSDFDPVTKDRVPGTERQVLLTTYREAMPPPMGE